MKVSQTKLELLENTIAYYSEDTSRRAVAGDGTCEYLTECGNKCAIGREMKTNVLDNVKLKGVRQVIHLLPYRLRKMGQDFLTEIQVLHDYDEYWDKNGLTRTGKTKVQTIKERYIS